MTATTESLYKASASPAVVDVPPGRFLMVDGTGRPGGDDFQQAIGALYSLAYTAKFALKKRGGVNVKLQPLEGLYDFAGERWTLMLRLPEAIDDQLVEEARGIAARKRNLPALDSVEVRLFDEGRCAQVLHVGPYSTEPETIARLSDFITKRGGRPRGRHHEIYISVPGRTRPERLKTILRQPTTA